MAAENLVLTPFATASYPSLFKKSPTCKEDRNKPENHKYQLTLLISPAEQQTDAYKNLKQAALAAFVKKFSKEDLKSKGFISPFKDAEEKYGEAYKGWIAIKTKTDYLPKVYDRARKEYVDDDSALSGALVRAYVDAWAWDNSKKEKSVSFSLYSVQIANPRGKSPDSSMDYSKVFDDGAEMPEGAAAGAPDDDDDLPF